MVANTHRMTTITLSLRAWVDKWGTFVVYIYFIYIYIYILSETRVYIKPQLIMYQLNQDKKDTQNPF